VLVLPPDAAPRKYGLLDFQKSKDEFGYDEYVLIPPDIKSGTVIEVGYESSSGVSGFLPPLEHEFPLQFVVPCESLSITYAYPDWWDIDFRNTGAGVDKAIVQNWDENSHKRIVKCVKKDIPAIANEPFSPFIKEMSEFLHFRITKFEMMGYSPDLAQTWMEVAERANEALTGNSKNKPNKPYDKKKKKNASDDVAEYAGKLVSVDDPPSTKVNKIVRHVQEEFDFGWKSKNAKYDKVIKDKEGSTYDLIGLVREFLECAGIPSEVVLVSSAQNGFFDEYFVSFDQLNYIGLRADINGVYRLVFPQYKSIPIMYVPEHIQGQRALIVTGDSLGFFWEVPFYDDQENFVSEKYLLQINDNGSINVIESKTMRGEYAQFGREFFKYLKSEEKKEVVEEFLTYHDGDVELISHAIENLENTSEPLVIKTEYLIDNLVTITPEEAIFKTGGLFSPISLKKSRMESSERLNPIVVRVNQHYDKEITINFPANWKIKNILENGRASNDFGELSVDYEVGESALTIHQKLLLRRGRVPKENSQEFLAITSENSDRAVPAVIFALSKTP
jgi:hypothetical protein